MRRGAPNGVTSTFVYVVNADRTEIVIQPGEHKYLVFIPRQPGSYKLICSDHDWAGMVGTIKIVQ